MNDTQFKFIAVRMDNSTQDIKMRAFKVIIVGPQAVGKSSILFRLSEAKFNTAYLSTVGIDFKTYATQVGDKHYSLQIWDTAGTARYNTVTPNYYRNVDGILLVFDISNRKSFEMVNFWIK